jgi:protocatechuate 3,4-dioxygenase alpha subunit
MLMSPAVAPSSAGHRLPSAEMTVGPFFPPRYSDAGANDLTQVEGRPARGEPIEIEGRVVQVDGVPMNNLVLEIWQADAQGIYAHPADPRHREADPGFFGWGRAATDADGCYRFRTIRPGASIELDGTRRAPHVNVIVLFSGIMRQLQTVIWLPETVDEGDPVYRAVPAHRRSGVVATAISPGRYRFDIRLRGEGETPFFAPDGEPA